MDSRDEQQHPCAKHKARSASRSSLWQMFETGDHHEETTTRGMNLGKVRQRGMKELPALGGEISSCASGEILSPLGKKVGGCLPAPQSLGCISSLWPSQ